MIVWVNTRVYNVENQDRMLRGHISVHLPKVPFIPVKTNVILIVKSRKDFPAKFYFDAVTDKRAIPHAERFKLATV